MKKDFKEENLNHMSSNINKLACVDFLLQNFLTELASGRGQLDDIIKMAEELVKSRHSKQREIQARQKTVTSRYRLNQTVTLHVIDQRSVIRCLALL